MFFINEFSSKTLASTPWTLCIEFNLKVHAYFKLEFYYVNFFTVHSNPHLEETTHTPSVSTTTSLPTSASTKVENNTISYSTVTEESTTLNTSNSTDDKQESTTSEKPKL